MGRERAKTRLAASGKRGLWAEAGRRVRWRRWSAGWQRAGGGVTAAGGRLCASEAAASGRLEPR